MALQAELESYKTTKERITLVNAKDYYGCSALIYACGVGNVDVIKFLLWYADVNQPDNRDQYPLHFAVLYAPMVQDQNKISIIEYLLRRGALNYPNDQWLTPTNFADMIDQKGLQQFILNYIQKNQKQALLEKPLQTMTKRFDQLCLTPLKLIPLFSGLPMQASPKLIVYKSVK
jgi:ankyrin repeat protein